MKADISYFLNICMSLSLNIVSSTSTASRVLCIYHFLLSLRSPYQYTRYFWTWHLSIVSQSLVNKFDCSQIRTKSDWRENPIILFIKRWLIKIGISGEPTSDLVIGMLITIGLISLYCLAIQSAVIILSCSSLKFADFCLVIADFLTWTNTYSNHWYLVFTLCFEHYKK